LAENDNGVTKKVEVIVLGEMFSNKWLEEKRVSPWDTKGGAWKAELIVNKETLEMLRILTEQCAIAGRTELSSPIALATKTTELKAIERDLKVVEEYNGVPFPHLYDRCDVQLADPECDWASAVPASGFSPSVPVACFLRMRTWEFTTQNRTLEKGVAFILSKAYALKYIKARSLRQVAFTPKRKVD